MTKVQLERYLKTILDVHAAMYELEKAFDSVELRKGSLGKAANIQKPSIESKTPKLHFEMATEFVSGVGDLLITMGCFGKILFVAFVISFFPAILAVILASSMDKTYGESFLISLLIEAGCIALYFIIKWIAYQIKKSKAESSYNEAKSKASTVYQQALAQDASRVEYENKIIAVLNFEQDAMRTNYSILKDKLQKLYDQNIIYEGYRNMIAVAQFYEYIASGMCDRLEGANGAYQQYQNFVNAGRICDKLDRISSQLDVIQRNQRMLYNAVMDIQQSLNNIENSLGRMEMSLNDIQQKVHRLTSAAVSAEQYMKENHQALQSIAKSVQLDALNTQVIALNARREAIANGVDAYFLEYPSGY